MSETTMPTGVNFQHPAHGHIKILNHAAGHIEEFTPDGRPRKKVAIVGFAESSRMEAPFDDPEWSIWGVNQLYRLIPRASRWFEIHHNWNEFVVDGTDHAGWIRDAPIPIYMKEQIEGLPNSVKYPLDEIVAAHGNPKYFTSTIAYMLALALHEGFTDIGIWGVDLIVGQEWDYQKACAEFWIGVAHGRGVRVHIPRASALCRSSYLYGLELEPSMWPIKISDVQKRVQDLKNDRHKLIVQLANIDGALQEAEFWHAHMDLIVKSGRRQGG